MTAATLSPVIYVIIPAFNESENVARLAASLRGLCQLEGRSFHFVFVDDGSSDGTAAQMGQQEFAEKMTILRHPTNGGPGKAFATGFEFLAERLRDEDLVVTIEGDNTSRMDTLMTMIGRIEREDADCAFASVYAYGGGFEHTSGWRIFLSHSASFLTKLLLNIHGLHTFTSFFRVYKGKVIRQLQKKYGPGILESSGFECMVELLKKIMVAGFTISEVPMKLDSSQRAGKSKMKVMKTMKGYFRIFGKARRWR